jgi:hypothetical protein
MSAISFQGVRTLDFHAQEKNAFIESANSLAQVLRACGIRLSLLYTFW